MKNLTIIGICIIGLWMAVPSAAHHSMAGFDRKNPVTLAGTVKNFNWQNPHCYIELDVPAKDGTVKTWNVEMTAPGYLVRAGWKKTMIQPGDKVTILAAPLLTGEPGALFVSVTLANGQTMTERSAGSADAKAK